jgi:hypothetical protein
MPVPHFIPHTRPTSSMTISATLDQKEVERGRLAVPEKRRETQHKDETDRYKPAVLELL